MSERRFVIYEVGTIAPDSARSITESELRLRAVLMFNAEWICKDDIKIDILIHGEGKEDWPDPEDIIKMRGKEQAEYHCEDCGKPMTKAEGGDTFTVCEKCWDKHYKRKPTKPSPAPTREEWEKWAENMPVTLDCKLDVFNTHDFRAWFLSMPIVPKEK